MKDKESYACIFDSQDLSAAASALTMILCLYMAVSLESIL